VKTKDIAITFSKKILILSVTIVICLLLLEIALRSLGYIASNMADDIYEKYGNSYRMEKNLKKTINWPSFSYVIYTNSFGFRDNKIGERNLDGKPYIIFLGDSATFANGVNYEDSFVGIFSRAASRKNIETLNMAVGGHYLADQKALLLDFLSNSHPKPTTVILCIDPALIYLFDQIHEDILVKNGYLLEGQFWRIAYLRMAIGNISSAYCFFRNNIRRISAKLTNYEAKVNDSFIKYFDKNSHMFDPETFKQFEDNLDRFHKYCREHNLKLVFVYLPLIDSFGLNELLKKIGKNPDDYDTSYYEEMMKIYCKTRNIKLVDPTPILKFSHDKGIPLRFTFDSHYNHYSHRLVGELLITKIF
jgi:hypothetical protein